MWQFIQFGWPVIWQLSVILDGEADLCTCYSFVWLGGVTFDWIMTRHDINGRMRAKSGPLVVWLEAAEQVCRGTNAPHHEYCVPAENHKVCEHGRCLFLSCL